MNTAIIATYVFIIISVMSFAACVYYSIEQEKHARTTWTPWLRKYSVHIWWSETLLLISVVGWAVSGSILLFIIR